MRMRYEIFVHLIKTLRRLRYHYFDSAHDWWLGIETKHGASDAGDVSDADPYDEVKGSNRVDTTVDAHDYNLAFVADITESTIYAVVGGNSEAATNEPSESRSSQRRCLGVSSLNARQEKHTIHG